MTAEDMAARGGREGAGPVLLPVLLAAVMALELTARATGSAAIETLTHAAMIAVIPVAARGLGLREAYLLTLSAVLSVLVVLRHPEPSAAIGAAFSQAAFLMAFILLLSLVQEAASTSRAVAVCGRYLTRQPPGRRFLSIYSGANVMSVLFNLGVVSLLAPLIRRGVEEASPGDALNPVRERRQLNALLRGFAWSVIWSPTALAPLALMTLIPGVDRIAWIGLGLAISVLAMLIGWGEDRVAWGRLRRRLGGSARFLPEPFPVREAAGFAAVCFALLGLTAGAMALLGGTVVFGLMVACPILAAAWLMVQNREAAGGPVRAAGERLASIWRWRLPLSAPVAVTLGASGYVGHAAAALLPAAEIAEAIGLQAMAPHLFLTGVAVAVAALSQLGLSPIMLAVFFGSLLGALPELPASPTLTALAISCGWALAMTSSPFATVVLVMARATEHSGREMTWGWNLPFTGLCVAALLAVFWALTQL